VPYEECRKLFEYQQVTRLSPWQKIRLGNTIKWALAGLLIVVAGLLVR